MPCESRLNVLRAVDRLLRIHAADVHDLRVVRIDADLAEATSAAGSRCCGTPRSCRLSIERQMPLTRSGLQRAAATAAADRHRRRRPTPAAAALLRAARPRAAAFGVGSRGSLSGATSICA